MTVRIEDGDGVRTITLDRPDKRNAITDGMFRQLTEALEGASRDASIRVVLLRGEGGQFTAGLDLDEIGKATGRDRELWSRRFLLAVAAFDKPLVAAVDRYALGVGCTVLLLCDLVYAAEGTEFRAPFVPMGLVPEAASTALLPAMAGHQRAAEILLFGEKFPVEHAYRVGIVNAVVASGELHALAAARAAALATLPTESVVATKALLRRGGNSDLTTVMDAEFAEFDAALARLNPS